MGAVADGLQLTEYLDANDRSDYFRFTLDKTSNTTVTLNQLSADADIYLADSDGLILQASKRSGNRSERIDTQLSAGEYFLVVRSYDGKATSYQLGWQIDAVAPPTTPLVPTPLVPTPPANDTPPVGNPPAETAPPNSPISPPTPSNPTPVDEAPLPPAPATPQPTDEVETSPTVPSRSLRTNKTRHHLLSLHFRT
ncbi:MAG: PPC domain-containing protein [Pirellulaceae bacterium]